MNNFKCLFKAEITSVLRQMYGDVPEPVGIHRTKWSTDPLAMGSFPSVRVGITLEDIKNLPRQIRNLHFAGKHYIFILNCL